MLLIEYIWKIRGKVDEGIIKHDPDMIKMAMEDLIGCQQDCVSLSEISRTFNSTYSSLEDKNKDKSENVNKLMRNMNAIYDRYVNGNQNASIKFGEEPKSIITTIWVVRAMFDDVVNKAKKPEYKAKQRELVETLESALEAIQKCRVEIRDLLVFDYKERNFLDELRLQVYNVMENLFGDTKVEKGFAHHSKNY